MPYKQLLMCGDHQQKCRSGLSFHFAVRCYARLQLLICDTGDRPWCMALLHQLDAISAAIAKYDAHFENVVRQCSLLVKVRKQAELLNDLDGYQIDQLTSTKFTNSIKFNVGLTQECCSTAVYRLNQSVFDIIQSIYSLADHLKEIAHKEQNHFQCVCQLLSHLAHFQTVIADECDVVWLYHFRTLFPHCTLSPEFPTLEPKISVISKTWLKCYLPKFGTCLNYISLK
ncbi:hypothetical protein EG68_04066 [Paragonimus skrjabini miyazakii]|uniref:Uncharacterized protein n=1 Tax=Paragonimus skrjabini miyazakii TaxID=59628 RepID=A0A8S9YTG0_9TREM|nr:hypothetical protein EG68_04066 [Paragonimus skrjabini miyazakii]